MSLIVGTNTYATGEELLDYALLRGIPVTAIEPETLLARAMDYIETRTYKGEKADPDQALQFPRNGDTAVPAPIKSAQIVAALIYDTGGDPLAPINPRVTQETVVGSVSVSYSDKGNQTTLYPHLTALLRPYLSSVGGTQFSVSRG